MPGDVKVLEKPESSEPKYICILCVCFRCECIHYDDDYCSILTLLVRVEVLAGESSSLFSFDLVSVLSLLPKNEEYGEAGTWVALVGE